MTEETNAALAAWVAGFVAETSREESVDAFVAAVDAAILADGPELAEDPVLVADLHASTRAQFQVFLSLLQREKQELLLPPQAVDLALSIARRQLELGVLLKVYRVAAAAVWEYFTQVAHQVPDDGPDRSEVLIYLWDHGGTWINEAIEQLISIFYEEREATLHGALARRTETVHALLQGDSLTSDAASTDLGHPLRGQQTALVLWADEGTSGEMLVALTQLSQRMAKAAAAPGLSVPAGRAEVWCWLATQGVPDLDAIESAAAEAPDGLRVSVGTTSSGIEGFRDSHREAVDAQRYAVTLPSAGRFTPYAEVELACLVAGNPRGVRALLRRELGDLAGDGRGLDRVRETVAAFLAFGGNVDQTASSLIVHKNTVRYRLSQAEEMVGHPLSERRTELALALQCLDRFGEQGQA